VVFGGLIVISAVAALAVSQVKVSIALVYQDGSLIERMDISDNNEPYSLTLENQYGYNVISVEHGRIRISEADCPDGFCVRQGWVSGGTVPIVCLPNRLVIRLEGGSDDAMTEGMDAIVG